VYDDMADVIGDVVATGAHVFCQQSSAAARNSEAPDSLGTNSESD